MHYQQIKYDHVRVNCEAYLLWLNHAVYFEFVMVSKEHSLFQHMNFTSLYSCKTSVAN